MFWFSLASLQIEIMKVLLLMWRIASFILLSHRHNCIAWSFVLPESVCTKKCKPDLRSTKFIANGHIISCQPLCTVHSIVNRLLSIALVVLSSDVTSATAVKVAESGINLQHFRRLRLSFAAYPRLISPHTPADVDPLRPSHCIPIWGLATLDGFASCHGSYRKEAIVFESSSHEPNGYLSLILDVDELDTDGLTP